MTLLFKGDFREWPAGIYGRGTCLTGAEYVERSIDVGQRVVDVPRCSEPFRPNGGVHSSPLELLRGTLDVAEDDRRVARLESEPGTESVREPNVVLVDRFHADLFDDLECRRRGRPT